MNTRDLANLIAFTLGETAHEAPEGHLYAAVMGKVTLDQFRAAVDVLIAAKLVERRPGPCLIASAKCREFVASYKGKAAA